MIEMKKLSIESFIQTELMAQPILTANCLTTLNKNFVDWLCIKSIRAV